MTTMTDQIDPYDDPRVTHKFVNVRGRKYHYVEGMPEGTPKATVLCVHGFPDLWYAWRATIPFLLKEGLHVIAPDFVGYGGTDAPNVPPESLEVYSWKHTADDIAELLKIMNIPKVILLGHDWGGAIISRVNLYHPGVVSHIASICTPYLPVAKNYVPLEDFVKPLPNFTYQLAFNEPKTEEGLKSKEGISRFFRALMRPAGDFDESKFQVPTNILESLGDQPRSDMITEKELNYYVDTYYAKENKFHGPLNWYKLRKVNYEDEKVYFGNIERSHIHCPYLFIGATKDTALPPTMYKPQEGLIDHLTVREIPTMHWAMIEDPEACNRHLKEWFDGVVFGEKSKL